MPDHDPHRSRRAFHEGGRSRPSFGGTRLRRMTQDDGVPSHYPCLMQKDGLRRVHEPRDERPVTPSPLRQAFTRLIVALRR
jgi:hypothetical protein